MSSHTTDAEGIEMVPKGAPTPLRRTRGAVSGTLCGLGAVAAHHLAGGSAVPLVALAVWPVSLLVCLHLARHRVTPGRAVVAAGLTQAAWHALLEVSGRAAGAHSGTTPAHSPMADPGMAHSGMADHPALLPMWAAHAVVAVVTAALCCEADRALVSAVVELLLPRLPRRWPVPAMARQVTAGAAPVRLRSRLDRGTRSARGPPVVLPA